MLNQAVQEKGRDGFCAFLLDRRRACCLIAVILAVACCFTSEWADVRENASAYLPEDSETRRGLTVMEAEFEEPAVCRILADNIAAPQAAELAGRLSLAAGVRSVDFDEASDYRTGVARLTVTFRDDDTAKALAQLRFMLEGYDYSIVGDTGEKLIDGELWLAVAAACAAALVLLALFLRVPAFTGVTVVLLTFGAAFLLNSGTWFLSGSVSPEAAWGSALLQFALCAVCVAPLFRRSVRARARMTTRDAVLAAWKRTAPEILCGGAALTLAALSLNLLHLRVGVDPGLTTAKAALLTLLTVCFLTPALIAELCEPLDRTLAREDAGGAAGLADVASGTRLVAPIVFVLLLVGANVCANYFPRVYGAEALPIWLPWGNQRAEARMESLFGTDNELSILIPSGDASRESALLQELSAMDDVRTARGLANMETMGGYTLAERLTPRQFAELMDIDMDAARLIYTAYAESENAYAHMAAGVDNAAIPLANMLLYACDRAREGYVTLNWGSDNALELLYRRTENAVRRMGGKDYTRLILNLSFPEGSSRSLAFLYALRNAVGRYYPEGVLFTGDAVRDADFSAAFQRDRVLFFAFTLAVALTALYLALGSMGAAIASAAVAQGGVWITFAVWLLAGQKLYFLTDLLVSAALMGMGLVFTASIAARWMEYRQDDDPKTALTRTLQETARPVALSGTAVALVSLGAGVAAPNRVVSSLGICLAIGAALSMGLALYVLPPTLLLLPTGAASKPDPVRTVKPTPPPPNVWDDTESLSDAETASLSDGVTESAYPFGETQSASGGETDGVETSDEKPVDLNKAAQESGEKEASDYEEN